MNDTLYSKNIFFNVSKIMNYKFFKSQVEKYLTLPLSLLKIPFNALKYAKMVQIALKYLEMLEVL